MPDVIQKLPLDFLQHHHLLPLGSDDEGPLRVGFYSRESLAAMEDVRLLLECDIEPVPMSREDVEEGLRNLMVQKLDAPPQEDEDAVVLQDEAQDLMRAGKDAPVVQLVNTLLVKAIGMNASDVHIEPYEDGGVVRMRVDGVLQEVFFVPKPRLPAVIARIKVMSRLNLAESRLPQDGRIKVKAGEHTLDLRVSTLPTLFGERVVMRLLRGGKVISLQEVGLWPDDYARIKSLCDYPHGLILNTGPTGSGKTTTLYGMMQLIQSPHRNMITIEDPVEYQVARISQIQVNSKIGMTFAAGLRSILRQDPDVIMVGEIRDSETADIAIHAALTGHLVLSTLHTNDSPTAISRLMDMGIENFLISSSLLGVLAQRLVRRLCLQCRKPVQLRPEDVHALGLGEDSVGRQVYLPNGCPNCNSTGFKGRSGVFEILMVDEEMRRVIVRSGGDANVIRQAAQQRGMHSLLEDGARKVLAGHTSVEEVLRATRT